MAIGFFDEELDVSFNRLKQDLAKRGRSRYLAQFQNSPVMNQLVDQMSIEMQECYDAGIETLEKRTLTKAEGINLDIIGYIVGVSRNFPSLELLDYFAPDKQFCGTDMIGVWVKNAPLSAERALSDEIYRKLIMSKIVKNHAKAGSAPENQYCGRYIANRSVSFSKIGLQDYRLVLPVGTNLETVIILTANLKNSHLDNFYLLPIPATVRLHTDVLFVIPTENFEGVAFCPDSHTGRPDYAKASITINLGGII